MLYNGLSARLIVDSDQVKAILVSGPALAKHPHRSHARDLPLLPKTDRLERRSTAGRPPRLDLYECHSTPLPDYEIEVMTAKLETVCLH